MDIKHLEVPDSVEGGVKVSARQQKKALDRVGLDYNESEDYDILHINFVSHLSYLRIWRAHRRGERVVVHAHSVGDNIGGTYRMSDILAPIFKKYFLKVYNAADMVIAVSEAARDRLRRNGVESEVVVISNGVDGELLDGFRELEPDDYGAEGFTVTNLAQVYEVKGVGEFIETAEKMPETDFRWFGPIHDLISPKKTRRKIENSPENVEFPGFIDDKREAFALGDIFFSPSKCETQGMSVLEAAYCEMPIVVRDLEAYGWLEHEEDCLKAESVEEFVEYIEEIREDEELRRKLSKGAKRTAEEHTLGRVGRELKEVYENLSEKK